MGCREGLRAKGGDKRKMRIKLAVGEKEKELKERVLMNLKAGKTVDSAEMAKNMGIDMGEVVKVMNELVSEGKAEKVTGPKERKGFFNRK